MAAATGPPAPSVRDVHLSRPSRDARRERGWCAGSACGWQLDLGDVQTAAESVTRLDGQIPLVVLTRGEDTTASWTAGQQHLAALSEHADSAVVPGVGHQIPSEAPETVVAAVESVLTGSSS